MTDTDVEIYDDTINPFDIETAKRFVYHHRNIFAKDTRRRIIYNDTDLIIVKEITIYPDEKEKSVWFWGFTKEKRGIVRDVSDDEAIEMLKKALT